MERIECTSYEKRELIRFLEYAKKMKDTYRPEKTKEHQFDDTDHDIKRIELLIQRVKGIAPRKEYVRDTLEWTHENKTDQENKINNQYYNRNRSKK